MPDALKHYDAILFDFDGVLADSERVHCACWAEVLRPLGINLKWESYRQLGVGLTDRDLVGVLAGLRTPPADPELVLAQYPVKRQCFLERMLSDPPVPAAIPELFRSLGDYKMAVVTSSYRLEVEPVLERVGLRAALGALVTAADVEHHKPSPEPYLEAARQLGAVRPLVVEDSTAGIASGRAAGFDVLAVRHPDEVPEAVRERLRTGPPRT